MQSDVDPHFPDNYNTFILFMYCWLQADKYKSTFMFKISVYAENRNGMQLFL